MIEAIATSTPLRRLPRRAHWSVRHGVQIMLDRGDAMGLFRRDQDHLAEEIRRIAGRETQVLSFIAYPARVTSAGRRAYDYAPPPSGTAVLIVTDLGIGEPAPGTPRGSSSRWQQFAARLARAGCPGIVLLPYPLDRCPAWATRRFVVLPWDRSTNAGQVTRMARARR